MKMESLKIVKTYHSQWLIDEVLQRFLRIPLDENPGSHPSLKYSGCWEEYDCIFENEIDDEIMMTIVRSHDGHRLVTYYPKQMARLD